MLYNFSITFNDGTIESFSSESLACSFEYEISNSQFLKRFSDFPDQANAAFLIQSVNDKDLNDNSENNYVIPFQVFKEFCEKIIIKMQNETIKVVGVSFKQDNIQILNLLESDIIALSFSGGVNSLDDLNKMGCSFQLFIYYIIKDLDIN